MEAGKVSPQRCGASLGDERNRGGEGDSRLERVRKLRERRRPGPLPLAHSALAPMPSPGQRRIGTADRPGEGEHGDVDERPGEPGCKRRRGENHEQEERRAERQLALAHETSEAPRAESDIRSTDGARPKEGDARGEDESEQEARQRDPPATRNPRASLTGYGVDVSVVRVGSVPLASIGPVALKEIRQTTIASSG